MTLQRKGMAKEHCDSWDDENKHIFSHFLEVKSILWRVFFFVDAYNHTSSIASFLLQDKFLLA